MDGQSGWIHHPNVSIHSLHGRVGGGGCRRLWNMSVAHTRHGRCHTYHCYAGQDTDTCAVVVKVDGKVAAGCAAEK